MTQEIVFAKKKFVIFASHGNESTFSSSSFATFHLFHQILRFFDSSITLEEEEEEAPFPGLDELKCEIILK